MDRLKWLEEMLNYMSSEDLLELVIRALSKQEVRSVFEWIANNHDIDVNFNEGIKG